MNFKTTLMKIPIFLRERSWLFLPVLFSFLLLSAVKGHAQTLVTDTNVPVLDACADYQLFTVKVKKSNQACLDGKLTITPPSGFELDDAANSVTLDGAPATFTGSPSEIIVEVGDLVGPVTEEAEISFRVKALCDVIGAANSTPAITYNLTGCTVPDQVGTSEVINIRYAVLRIDVTPSPIIGNIGDEIERTIEVRNQGNGDAITFNLERNLGGGLAHVSYDFSQAVANGWTIDDTDPNQLVFSGNVLGSGESVTIKEKVTITDCALTPTEFEVYYGCTAKCTNAGVNGIFTHIVNLQVTNAPTLSVAQVSQSVTCYNALGSNEWEVTNTGSVSTETIQFEIRTQDTGGYIDASSILVNGALATIVDDSNPQAIIVEIPALAAGSSTIITFDQYYPAPSDSPANCASAPTQFSIGQSSFSATYSYTNACAPITNGGTVKGETTYNYAGFNVGEIDIVNGSPYSGDYLFSNYNIPSAGLNVGDQFVMTLALADDLSTTGFSFGGVPAVSVGGNIYEITFTYGTAPWNIGEDLDFSFERLQFPLQLNCPANLNDLWFSIGGELRKTGCDPIVFKCNQTTLEGSCDAGPCVDGLSNGSAEVTRVSLGDEVDGNGVPVVGTTATNAEIRSFIAGDVLEIYQNNTVRLTTETSNRVRFVVEKDASINAILRPLSGKVTVNGTDVGNNLAVTETASSYVLEYTMSTALADGDQVRLALQIKSGSSSTGLKQFPTRSYLIADSDNEALLCGRTYTATGLFLPNSFNFSGSTANFVECVENSNTAIFTANILGFSTQDAIFNNEFRKLFSPTNVTFSIPQYLTLEGVTVTINNQPWLGSNNTFTLTGLTETGNYVFDLANAIEEITAQTLGAGNGIDYLDEGFALHITPIVSLDACEEVQSNRTIGVALAGNTFDGEGLSTAYSQSQDLVYRTGKGTLRLRTSNNNLLGQLNEDGTEVSWVVRVASAGERNFHSVWMAKKSGVLDITSIEEVDNYAAANPQTALIANANGIYELGDFASGSAKFYLIKANVVDCTVHNITLTSGYSCASNDYPVTINDGCLLPDLTLTHKSITSILQTTLHDQFNGNSSTKPDLCDTMWYTVQLHNAGDTQLDNLQITIPLDSAEGLVYGDLFEYSNVFAAAGGSANTWTTGNTVDAVVNGANELVITLPASISLNTLERVRIRVYYEVDDCNFKSGARHTVTPSGINTCGINVTNINPATTNRLIIAGGSDSFPELREEGTTSIVLDPVLSTGGNLRAIYNTEIINSGDFGVNDVVTDEYQVALKLPNGWTIVGDPQDYLLPAGKFNYVGLDPVRGYLYDVASGESIAVGETINFYNVPLKYTMSDETTLTCNHLFGDIEVSVFQNISVSDCSPLNCSSAGIDQELYSSSIVMQLPVDSLLGIVPENQFPTICNPTIDGGVPTIADIELEDTTNVFHLDWYENELEAIDDLPEDRLSETTPLVDGRTYYVINRFIVNGDCKSNIGKIKVSFVDNDLSGELITICNANSQTYQIQVTLSGTAPYNVTGTGAPGTFAGNVWTSEPIAASTPFTTGTPYEVTFTDDSNCTPLTFAGAAPMCCELEIICPVQITIDCQDNRDPSLTGVPTIINSCGNTSYTYTDSGMSTCTNGEKSFTRTFTVTDEQGNVEVCTQIINVVDNVDPVFNEALPSDITVSCASEVPSAAQLTATDNCGNAQVTFSSTETPGACANDYIIERVWTATDGCGNSVSYTQTITVIDDIAPVISTPAQSLDRTVECSDAAGLANAEALVPMATDNCTATADLTLNISEVTAPTVGCSNGYTLVRTMNFTDSCGNTSANYVQTITVVDTTAPVFDTSSLPSHVTVSCESEIPSAIQLMATDNCSTSADISYTVSEVVSNVSPVCGNNYTLTRTYTATDGCGNSVSYDHIITIKDDVSPVFNEALPSNVTVSCASAVPAAAVLTATDNCSSNVLTAVLTETEVSGSCANRYVLTRVWRVTDSCGNMASHTQVITVSDDTAPEITLPNSTTMTVECDGMGNTTAFDAWLADHGGATATDNCDAALTWSYLIADTNDHCEGSSSIIVDFTATDSCGNSATFQGTFVIEDNVAPVIDTAALADLNITCSSTSQDELNAWLSNHGGATATDLCGDVTWSHDYQGGALTCGRTTTVTFMATDSCGNASTVTADIIFNDNEAPVFNGALPQNATYSCASAVPEAPILTATDNCGNAPVTFDETIIPGSCVNNYTIERVWTATDACGNETIHTQTITVNDDINPTFVGTLPAATVNVSCASAVPEAATLTATDNCGSATVTFDETRVDGDCDNNFTLTRVWTATDACGNTTVYEQVVIVDDQTAPIITSPAQSLDRTVECSDATGLANALALEPTATDNCGVVTWSFTETNTQIPIGCEANNYTIERVWTATDACGNTSANFVQTITVIDTTAPVFTGDLPTNVTVSCVSEIPATVEASLTATDNCSANVTITVNDVISNVSPACANNYTITRTYTATDECGNATTHIQTITVKDETVPTFNEALPQNATYSCSSEVPSAPTLTATDNCSVTPITAVFVETRVDGSCANSFVLTRTWTATDECGNAVTHTQTITVSDNVAPIFTTEPQNKIVECDGLGNLDGPDGFYAWLADNAGAVATDNCGDVTITYLIEDTNTICGGSGTIIVDFIAKDECGNMTIKQATYAIFDRTPPTVTPASDLVIECGVNGEDELNAWLSNNGGATATDTCGLVTWAHDYQGSLAVCGAPVTVTFTATDACGNTNTTQAAVSVVDTIAPTLTVAAQPLTVQCGANTDQVLNNWLANHGGAEAIDSCATVTWTNDYDPVNFAAACGNTGSVEVTFTGSDSCGNTVTTAATFTIEDTIAPVITTAIGALNRTVECSDATSLGAALALVPTATDSCGTVEVAFDETIENQTCGNYTITRVWTATDECGNVSADYVQTIIVVDTTKPVITTKTNPVNAYTECGGTDAMNDYNAWLADNGGFDATDNCSDITWSYYLEDTNTVIGLAGTVTVNFKATDACGNFAVRQATFAFVDTTLPTIIQDPTNLVIECSMNGEDELNAWLSNFGGAQATDNCGTVTWSHNYQGSLQVCGAPIIVTFTATDEVGLQSTVTATVEVVDTTDPILTKQAQSITVQCGANTDQALNNWLANHGGAEAIDSCATVTWTNDYDPVNFAAACGNTGSVEVTFTGSDSCGNTVTTTATFTIEDTAAPTLVTPAQPQTAECGADAEAALLAWLANNGGATATDSCAADLTWTNDYNDGANFIAACGNTGEVTVTFTATDDCGNSVSTVAKFTIADTTKPIFTTEPQNETVECGADSEDAYNAWLISYAGAEASDNCGSVTYSYTLVDTVILCGNTNQRVVRFTATDECGNRISKQATFTTEDTIAPDVTDAVDLVIECGTDINAQITTWLNNHGGATATETCGAVTWAHNYNGLTTPGCGNTGSALVTFTATDACGNAETTQATVQVVDTTDPVLTVAAQPLTVQCGANTDQALNNWLANHGGAEAIDSCATVTWTNDYDPANFVSACGETGSVSVTFTGSDSCGNFVETVAVFTIEDTVGPTILTPAQPQTVECGADSEAALQAWLANNGGATASDSCDSDLTWTNNYDVANMTAACGNTGEVLVTFTATDDCGNSNHTVAKFTIVDTTKPIFDVAPQHVEVECDGNGNVEDYNAWLANNAGAQASDNCGEVTYSYELVDTATICGKTQIKTVRFIATDECGNFVTKQATFEIVDTTAPEFVTAPEDVIVECDGFGNINDLNAWLDSRGGATAQDICATDITWSNNYRGLTTTCGGAGFVEVTFTATDACGNSSSQTATFTVQDTTAPEFVGDLPAKEIFVRCEDLMDAEELTAIDNCGEVSIVTYDEIIPDECGSTKYDIIRRWVATDECGNESVYTQTIHMSCKIEVFNAVTPNGDGYNDELVLEGIACYPGNSVEIYNRWGVLVYETTDYDSNGNTFKGYSTGRSTISQDGMLPSGTYYYIIKYNYDLGNGEVYPIDQAGYLHLETNK